MRVPWIPVPRKALPDMLRELAVQNLALIEDVRVELQPGFCAWTGETGAGKSLLLGGLGLLLGERGSADLIRAGADELRVTGRFDLDSDALRAGVAEILGAAPEENEVILSRRLSRTGRSQAYVNDQPAAVGTLRQLGNLLVDVHGQRESESLLQPAVQLELLDALGNLSRPRQAYLDLAEQVRACRRTLADLGARREQRQRELSLLRFERDELDAAALTPGELAELAREHERLAHAQDLQAFATAGYSRLYEEDGSVVEQLGKLQKDGHAREILDPDLAAVIARIVSVQGEVQDIARTLEKLGQRWEPDPERLAAVEQRIQLLKRLEAKYRKTVDELIAYRQGLDEQEGKLERQEEDFASTEQELSAAFRRLRDVATELSKGRAKSARRLASETQKQLAELGMGEARLTAELTNDPLGEDLLSAEVPAWGADRLELTLAANPGEAALPLRRVASGGELSRTMLALKTVLASHDRPGTLVFDEIDANVGGRLGDVLGQKLAALGRTHQVICVTHLPQVASYAATHWTVRKAKRGGRTVTEVTQLEAQDRLEELASMLRGEARGETTRKEAAAMLESARKRR
jgi:DNA repair protein RecN (Recombination protein N)